MSLYSELMYSAETDLVYEYSMSVFVNDYIPNRDRVHRNTSAIDLVLWSNIADLEDLENQWLEAQMG